MPYFIKGVIRRVFHQIDGPRFLEQLWIFESFENGSWDASNITKCREIDHQNQHAILYPNFGFLPMERYFTGILKGTISLKRPFVKHLVSPVLTSKKSISSVPVISHPAPRKKGKLSPGQSFQQTSAALFKNRTSGSCGHVSHGGLDNDLLL